MTGRIARRQALRILGAAFALPTAVVAVRSMSSPPAPVRWHGEALGGLAGMALWHSNPGIARRAIARMTGEVARLEGIFSLYRRDSEISRLNREGHVAAASRDLRHVLNESRRIAEASKGAFDPTIQPLWRLHSSRTIPEPLDLAAARDLVDFTAISASRREVRFDRPGMAISLNGIAQGHITDRITELLGNEGFEHAVIQLGETRALGTAPVSQPFDISLVDPDAPGSTNRALTLENCALSVSGGYGKRLSASAVNHIFDPATGLSATRLRDVAVTAPKAIWADALSTAIFVAGEQSASEMLATCPAAKGVLTRHDGTRIAI